MSLHDIDRLLRPQVFKHPKLRRVLVEPVKDGTGDDALYVWVIFDDTIAEHDLSFTKLRPLRSKIKTILQERGEARWPYIWFRRQCEMPAALPAA